MKKHFSLAALALACTVVGGAFFSAANAADATPTPQEMYTEYDAKILPLREQLYNKRMELAALHNSASPDQAKVQLLVKEIADLQATLYNTRLELDAKYQSTVPYGSGYQYGMDCGMGMGMGMGGMGHGRGRGWGGGHHGGHGGHRGGW